MIRSKKIRLLKCVFAEVNVVKVMSLLLLHRDKYDRQPEVSQPLPKRT